MKKSILILIAFAALVSVVIMSLTAGKVNKLDLEVEYDSDLSFSHKFHIEEMGAECEFCHKGVEESKSGTDDLLPKEEDCMMCHDREEGTCGNCHGSPDNVKMLPRIKEHSAKFSHKQHLDEGYTCEDCHAGVSQKQAVDGGLNLPVMKDCMSCHDLSENIQDCCVCHTKDEQLEPESHTELWQVSHGSFGESMGVDNCQTCHTESYCQDCHAGENLFNEAHPADFILTHSISYQMRESDCASCHTGYNDCQECHTQVNFIVPMNHNAPDWLGQHQIEGKINPDNCVVCHSRADPTCVRCHGE